MQQRTCNGLRGRGYHHHHTTPLPPPTTPPQKRQLIRLRFLKRRPHLVFKIDFPNRHANVRLLYNPLVLYI